MTLLLTTWAWFGRSPHPLLRFDALRVPSFRVTNLGGSVYRMVITAVPFLLPLMFQLGFGWSPVRAGVFVLLLFAGNVLIKPATSPLLRRLGFRTVLIASIIGGALVLVAIALLEPTTPSWIVALTLVLSGVLRSVGFSAYNSLQFADIDPADLADANTLSSTLAQVGAALGVAVGALLLRLCDHALGGSAAPLDAYSLTLRPAGRHHDATTGTSLQASPNSRPRVDPPLTDSSARAGRRGRVADRTPPDGVGMPIEDPERGASSS